MSEVKRRARRNWKTSARLAIGCLGAAFVLLCACRKRVHEAESAAIPKVLVLTTNVNDVAPQVSLSIVGCFESLPTAWYCSHYGSGDGTKPWYKYDTTEVSDKNGPVLISLTFNKPTYCPYVLRYLSVGLNAHPWASGTRKKELVFWRKEEFVEDFRKMPPDTLNISAIDSGGTLLFDGENYLVYSIPETGKDTMRLALLMSSLISEE